MTRISLPSIYAILNPSPQPSNGRYANEEEFTAAHVAPSHHWHGHHQPSAVARHHCVPSRVTELPSVISPHQLPTPCPSPCHSTGFGVPAPARTGLPVITNSLPLRPFITRNPAPGTVRIALAIDGPTLDTSPTNAGPSASASFTTKRDPSSVSHSCAPSAAKAPRRAGGPKRRLNPDDDDQDDDDDSDNASPDEYPWLQLVKDPKLRKTLKEQFNRAELKISLVQMQMELYRHAWQGDEFIARDNDDDDDDDDDGTAAADMDQFFAYMLRPWKPASCLNSNNSSTSGLNAKKEELLRARLNAFFWSRVEVLALWSAVLDGRLLRIGTSQEQATVAGELVRHYRAKHMLDEGARLLLQLEGELATEPLLVRMPHLFTPASLARGLEASLLADRQQSFVDTIAAVKIKTGQCRLVHRRLRWAALQLCGSRDAVEEVVEGVLRETRRALRVELDGMRAMRLAMKEEVDELRTNKGGGQELAEAVKAKRASLKKLDTRIEDAERWVVGLTSELASVIAQFV